MDGKAKSGGLAVVLVTVGLVAFIGFTCWAVVGIYWEVETSKRASRARMERVRRQIELREAGEVGR